MKNTKICALICTHNRASLLGQVLESLKHQSLDKSLFEIVLIDDGSNDNTDDVANLFTRDLPLFYHKQVSAGLASARNTGLKNTSAPITVMMDDDDIPDIKWLERHLSFHEANPNDIHALLGRTLISQEFDHDPLMSFVTKKVPYLFSYKSLKANSKLDFWHFWGGRTSFKTNFVRQNGGFNPIFNFGCEDIELGYRLSKKGLQMHYDPEAITTMSRAFGVDAFSRRLYNQGRANSFFSSLHPTPEIRAWAEIDLGLDTWPKLKEDFDLITKSAQNMDALVRQRLQLGAPVDSNVTRLLESAYYQVFQANKFKGIYEHYSDH